MPRLTSMPERNSAATRRAMIVWLSMVSALGYEIVDKRGWRDDVVWGDQSHGNDIFSRDDHCIGGHCHDGIEVPCGQRIGQVAEIVGQKGMDQREVRVQCGLDQIGFAL